MHVSLPDQLLRYLVVCACLTWQTDGSSPQRMAFKALLNAKLSFPRLCLSFLCAYCSKKLPEWATTKTQLRVLSIIDQLREWAHWRSAYAQLSPLYPSLYPYVTHVIRPSPAFRTASDGKLGGAWEQGYHKGMTAKKSSEDTRWTHNSFDTHLYTCTDYLT